MKKLLFFLSMLYLLTSFTYNRSIHFISIYDDNAKQCIGCKPTAITWLKTMEQVGRIIELPIIIDTIKFSTIKSQEDFEQKIRAIKINPNDILTVHTVGHGICEDTIRHLIKDAGSWETFNLKPIYKILREKPSIFKLLILDACATKGKPGKDGKKGDAYDENLWAKIDNQQKEALINLFTGKQMELIDFKSATCETNCQAWGDEEKGGFFTKNLSNAMATSNLTWCEIFWSAYDNTQTDAFMVSGGKIQVPEKNFNCKND